MSYAIKGNHLAYMVPNIPVALNAAEVLKEIDIGASSADHGEFICVRPCTVTKLGFVVAGEVVGGTSAAPTVVFTKRPTPLSSSGEAAIGTLTIPDTTAVGKVVYKNLSTPVALAVGDSVEISHTVGTGSPTGMGIAFMICEEDPEYDGNNTDMVASA